MQDVELAAEWLLYKLYTESNDNLITITRVLTGIWFARNKKVWEEKTMEANIVMEMSSKQIQDWQTAQLRNQFHSSPMTYATTEVSKWKAPEIGWVKLNVDASVKEGDPFFSIGMVIRNEFGRFVMGKNMKISGQSGVMEAEAFGVLEALHWIQELQLTQVIIESDSSLVVQALKQHSDYVVEVGNILDACGVILQNISDLVICHGKKHVNRVAHNLANIPCLVGCYNLFISPPHCVLEILLSDLP